MVKRTVGFPSASCLLSLMVAGGAHAQEPIEDDAIGGHGALEEITVTAQRKAEGAQDVPIAISAFGEKQLKELGIDQPIDVAAQTPAVYIKNGIGSANPYISVRNVGQSLFVSNASQPVGMYVNDVNLSYTSLMSQPLFDIERVEVLKGPQGTLFGRNSTGGALSIFTIQPKNQFEAGFEINTGNYGLFETDAHLNVPVSDTFAARLALNAKRRDGFFTNLLNGNDIGGPSYFALRLSNRWVPSDRLTVNLVLDGSFDRSGNTPWQSYGFADPGDPVTNADLMALGTVQGDGVDFSRGNAFGRNEVYGATPFVTGGLGSNNCSEADTLEELTQRNVAGLCATHTGQSGDGDLFDGSYSLEPEIDHDLYSANLNVQYDFGHATLTSVTGYLDSNRSLEEEFDGTFAVSADNTYRARTKILSQELRLAGDTGIVDWVGGLYYAHDEIKELDTYVYDDIWFFTHLVDFDQTTDNLGVFAHTRWELTERLGITLAGRFTNETIEFDGGTSAISVVDSDIDVFGYGLPLIAQQRTNPPVGLDEFETDEFTWKAGVEFRAAADTLLYAFVSRGAKSGGYNGTWTVTDDELRPYAPESLTDYEAGFKSTLLGNTVQVNGGVFYYDYRDLQAFVLNSALLFVVDNIPKTEVIGGELDIQWAPTENLDLRAGVSYTSAEIREVTTDQINNGILVGNTTANSADWMFNALAKYTWHVGPKWQASAQVSANYQSKTFFTVQNTPAASQDALWLTNARCTVEPVDGPWQLAFWAKNITDERYVTEAFPDPAEGLISYNVGAPRTYGVTVSVRF